MAGVEGLTVIPASVMHGCPWSLDAAHAPDTGYVPFILFRDPWDLLASQANAMFSATTSGGQWGMGQPRACAWDHRTAVKAARISANAPSWLLPQSTMEKWVRVQQQFIQNNIIEHQAPGLTNLARVFHVIEAANIGGNDQYDCHGKVWAANHTFLHTYQEAFVVQAWAIGVLLRPDDALEKAQLEWFVPGVSARYDGVSGWPRTMGPNYVMLMRNTPSSPIYNSWAEAWTANAPYALTGACPPPAGTALPPIPTAVRGGDYANNDDAALSLAVIAGLTQYRGPRDFLDGYLRGQVTDALSYQQV
jgi:hypothetical protein